MRDAESIFERIQDFRAAGMTGEAVDILQLEIVLLQIAVQDGFEIIGDERRNTLREAGLQSVFLDFPAHDVERVGPGVLACRTNLRTSTFRRHDRACRTVAKKRGCDDVALGDVVLAKGQRAQLYDEK